MEPQNPSKIKALFFRIKNKVKERRIQRFLIGLGVILFFLGVVFLLFPQKEGPLGPTPSPTPKPLDLEIANWNTFSQEGVPISFKYPPQARIDSSEAVLRVQVWGETQPANVEIVDGINIMIFPEEDLTGDLRQFVQKKVADLKQSGWVEIVRNVYTFKVGGKTAYGFVANSSLGEYTEIYVQTKEDKYLRITTSFGSVSGFDFEEMLKLIISSVEIN